MWSALVPGAALAVDRLFGEPPERIHPVVVVGHALDRAAVVTGRTRGPVGGLVAGAVAVLSVATAAGLSGALVQRACRRLPGPVGTVVEGAVLSTLLSDRMLRDEGRAVEVAVAADPVRGRVAVARLVSRDVAALGPADVRAAAIESLAENTGDSIVAPLVAWLVAGLPGAAVHRVVNTADAMWGYHDDDWEWRGKAAARLDDLVNLVPARIAARLLAPRVPWRHVAEQARHTPSPNAGWPMAAVALRFDLRLAKEGVHLLHAPGRPPGPGDVDRVARVVATTGTITAVLAGLATVARHRSGRASW